MEILWGEKEFLLFKYLLKNPYVNFKEVEKELPLSHMTIRNSIENINDFFKKKQIDEIQIIRGNICFPVKSLSNFSIDCNFFSTNIERFDYLLIKFLFEKEVVLSKEIEILKVSRKTLEKIVDSIASFIEEFNLKIISQPWNGFSLQGELEDKILLATEFIASLFISKELNPDFYRIFKIEESNIVYKQCWKKISKENKLFSENYVLKLSKSCNNNDNIFLHYLNIAHILVLEIYGVNTNNFSDFKIENNNFIQKKIIKCINEIQEKLKLDIPVNKLIMIKKYLYIGNYKGRFKLNSDNLKIEDFPLHYQKTVEKIKPIILKNLKYFYDEDILSLIFEFKNIFFSNNYKYKRILLIDSTNNIDLSIKLLKNQLKMNYNVNSIEKKSIFSVNDWEKLGYNYDVVFFLNNYTMNIFNQNKFNIKIPYYLITGSEFIRDTYFFISYGIELKI
ncbi:MAG: helix-turn-helix domain-containing protein [Cetobacterium sp.]